jgi:hypothetical protein
MLRPQGSRIELTNRDLDWHHQRSALRIRRNDFNSNMRFRIEERFRRRTLSRDSASAYEFASADVPPFPAEPVRSMNMQQWEQMLIQNRRNLSSDEFSPQLPRQGIRDSVSDDPDSATDTLSTDWETEDEDVAIPTSVDPNVRAADELEAEHRRAAARSHLDGTIDPRGLHPLSASHEVPQHRIGQPFPGLLPRHGPLPFSLPLRLRDISSNAPALGSPLRFSEAARSSSPERLSAPMAYVGSSLISEGRMGVLRFPDQPARTASFDSESFDLPQMGEIQSSPIRQRLEQFSPASDAELERLRTSVYRAQPQTMHRAYSEGDHGPPSTSSSTSESEPSFESAPSDTRFSISYEAATQYQRQVQTSPIVPSRTSRGRAMTSYELYSPLQYAAPSISVYNDPRDPSLEPETPVGLPRHGIPPTSLSEPMTAPPTRRARHVEMQDPRQWAAVGALGRAAGRPTYDGDIAQENHRGDEESAETGQELADARMNEEGSPFQDRLEMTTPRRESGRPR